MNDLHNEICDPLDVVLVVVGKVSLVCFDPGKHFIFCRQTKRIEPLEIMRTIKSSDFSWQKTHISASWHSQPLPGIILKPFNSSLTDSISVGLRFATRTA